MTKSSKESNNFLYITTMRTNNTNMMNLTLNVVNITLCNIRPSEGSLLFRKFVS